MLRFLQRIREWVTGRADDPALHVTNEQIEELWEGTPFLEMMQFARVTGEGKDKTILHALAGEAFAGARNARGRDSAATREFLCLALAYYLLAGELQDAATALGNLAMLYESDQQFDIALRLQRHALALKVNGGALPEAIARSHWLMGRAHAALGDYRAARSEMQLSLQILENPRVKHELAWVEQRIAQNATTGMLPPEIEG
jgi:hypothetical protein